MCVQRRRVRGREEYGNRGAPRVRARSVSGIGGINVRRRERKVGCVDGQLRIPTYLIKGRKQTYQNLRSPPFDLFLLPFPPRRTHGRIALPFPRRASPLNNRFPITPSPRLRQTCRAENTLCQCDGEEVLHHCM